MKKTSSGGTIRLRQLLIALLAQDDSLLRFSLLLNIFYQTKQDMFQSVIIAAI